ncbi:MAG TPA: AAA family ATPase [Planctomycetota bacterium]|nr:AAA family ATPase [Planctomycetota bacterium]
MDKFVHVDSLENPYRPGAGTAPPTLIGRDALIDDFGVTIRRALARKPGKSLMPLGLRGVGKTVLLNRFAEIAANEGYRVAFIEAPETGDFRVLLAGQLRKVLLALDSGPVRRLVRSALQVLKSFTYTLPDGSTFQLDVEAAKGQGDSGDLASDLTDLLGAVGQAAVEKSVGLLLAVDEVQYLPSDHVGALIAAIHRTTQLGLPVVFVGTGLPQLAGLAGQAKSYAERLFNFPVIGSLVLEEAREALSIPAAEKGIVIKREALDLMVAESHGYPYFLQEWGYHVWNLAGSSPISVADVRAARPTIIDQLDKNFFLVRFDRLTPKEREYLRAMATLGPGPHRSGDIAHELGVRVESVAPRRSELIAKGMIYSPAHGDTAFTVPLFDEFLVRKMPDWPKKPRRAR